MRNIRMGAMAPMFVAVAALSFGTGLRAVAQHDMGNESGPPKYLYLNNVELKAGHEAEFVKLESEENDAMRAAKIPAHHFGMWSITGNSNRVLFFSGYESYAEMGKVHSEIFGNPTVAAVMDKNNAAEGMFTQATHGSVYEYQKELSLNPPGSLEDMRFARIILFHVRAGQGEAFEHLVKEYVKLYAAALPGANWAMFEKDYGAGGGGTYMLVTPMKSLGDVDTMMASGKTFRDKTGSDLLALMRAQGTAVIKSSEADLFAFGPKISYVPDKWMTDSPDYWGKK